MTQGRGFIGLAAMIVGRWTPLGAFGAALLFASSVGLGRADRVRRAARRPRRLPESSLPGQFFDALPYLVTIVVLAGRHRPAHPAGGRRPALRARGRDLTAEERARARDILDLQEGRGPVAGPGRRRDRRAPAASRRIAVVGASSRPFRPSSRRLRVPRRGRLRRACRSTRTSRRSTASPPSRPSTRRSPRPGRSTSSTSSGARTVHAACRGSRGDRCALPVAPARRRELGGGPHRGRRRPGRGHGSLHRDRDRPRPDPGARPSGSGNAC